MSMINVAEWSKISESDFQSMQFDSGMIVRNFDPTNVSAPADEDIVCTTTGGITATLTPTINDLGEDVNNLHGRFKELLYLSRWDASLTFTALNMTPETLKLALGAADITAASGKVAARMALDLTDFGDIAWVGMRVDGGIVACVLKNALGTAGLSISTTKEGKGQLAVTLTGHMAMSAQQDVPMEFYSINGDGNTLASMTVASAVGTNSGTTKITISNYTKPSGATYVYKTNSSSAPTITYGETPDYTWTAWDGTSDIVATTGHYITIVARNSGGAIASGSATVTAKT